MAQAPFLASAYQKLFDLKSHNCCIHSFWADRPLEIPNRRQQCIGIVSSPHSHSIIATRQPENLELQSQRNLVCGTLFTLLSSYICAARAALQDDTFGYDAPSRFITMFTIPHGRVNSEKKEDVPPERKSSVLPRWKAGKLKRLPMTLNKDWFEA